MFEAAELGRTLPKKEYEREVPKLREALLVTQYELLEKASFPVLIVCNGLDGAGKGETANVLNEWMDPRHIQTHGMGEATDEERMRPAMYRFWRRLPPKGKTGLFVGSWYSDLINDRARYDDIDDGIDQVVRFERMLASEGALILKFWFHLSKAAQQKRLETLGAHPDTSWRVTPDDWRHFRHYESFREISGHVLRRTHTEHAAWHVVEGVDARYRSVTVGRTLLEAIRARLDAPPSPPAQPPSVKSSDGDNTLEKLDLSPTLTRATYDRQLAKYQREVNLLSRSAKFRDRAFVGVWEGMDAAGKGGSIRRLTRALDARYYDVIPVGAPTEEERAQPYLWRFWSHLPRHGKFALFDRSWYGRVLVERVEGLASETEWRRAYQEINDFEEQLTRSGLVVVKFWLHLSKDEQLRRFQKREKTSFKRFKLTPDDWRNRKRWDAYENAAAEMIEKTSTANAPWTLVSGEDKHHARIAVLKTVVERLEEALGSA